MGSENVVRDNKDANRFEMALGGERRAFIEYEQTGEGVITLTHTEVPDEFEGKGVGGALVKGALGIVERDGRKIVPACSFVAAYLRRHPEYRPLVA